MLDKKQFFVAAQFGKTFGIKGWISLRSFCEQQDKIFDYLPWYTLDKHNHLTELDLTDYASKNKLLAKVSGYNTPEAARELVNKEIYVSKQHIRSTQTDEYYCIELESLLVYNQHQQLLGKVASVLATGANDVLCLVPTGDSIDNKQHLIPYIDTVITSVDIENKKIIVNWDTDY